MKNRLIYGALLALIHFSAVADTYRDALSAFNSGHLDVARQMVNQLTDEHPDKGQLLESIDSAAAAARTPAEYQVSVQELEQQQEGKVFRSLDDPQLLEQLYNELDRSSNRYATETLDSYEYSEKPPVDSSITVDQQVAMLHQKMVNAPLQLASNKPGMGETLVLNGEPELLARQSSIRTPGTRPPGKIGGECLSPEQIKGYFSKARTEAAAFAMDKARAIAKANEIRQQRAVARMRLEITAEVTAKIRRQLDNRFDKEVAARVAALASGELHQRLDQRLNNSTGAAELLLARRFAGEEALGSGDSRAWLELAAAKGNAQAQFELGQWFFQSASGEADYALARSWWERAEFSAHVDAAAALAMLRQRRVATGLAATDTP